MKSRSSMLAKHNEKYFIDLFAGCGGLSLGLANAGWIGRFAVEKDRSAFRTLKTNLLTPRSQRFKWPRWLPKRARATSHLLSKYRKNLEKLRGKVDLIAGGPPCQGFSMAGRRIHSDPRNSLMREYLRLVKTIQPRFILVENVQGFDLPFLKNGGGKEKQRAYSKIVTDKLASLGYKVFSELVDLSLFGVPQRRKRFILVAIKSGDSALDKLNGRTPFDLLRESRVQFLRSKRLRTMLPVSRR